VRRAGCNGRFAEHPRERQELLQVEGPDKVDRGPATGWPSVREPVCPAVSATSTAGSRASARKPAFSCTDSRPLACDLAEPAKRPETAPNAG
jgi:hypothetical protein